MKSAIGNAFIMNFIIIFTVIFIGLFVTSLSYTKAMKVKNKITDIIEVHNGFDDDTKGEIEAYLKEAGYKISKGDKSKCTYKNSPNGMEVVYPKNNASNYDYCVFKFENDNGTYYGVKTYMYLDIPVIGDVVKIGIYGETKTLGILD